ncbi:hypothetical protein CsSME_00018908 [Camellia sinensis var. sinensis]
MESPHKSVEPKLGAEAEDRVKKVREWRKEKGVRWDELVLPSTWFALNLGPQPLEEDPVREEMEVGRKAKEEEERRLFARRKNTRRRNWGLPQSWW